jgi:hypothetical protein
MTRSTVLLAVMGALLLCACDSAGDASCADCQTSFTQADCDSFAKSQGCASAEAVVDPQLCGGKVTACHFHGCGDLAVLCNQSLKDSGATE